MLESGEVRSVVAGERERRLQLALDTAELGSWRLDAETLRLHGCPRFHAHLGVDADAAATLDALLACLHDNDADGVRQAITACLDDGRPLDLLCRSAQGQRWLQLRAERHLDAVSGRPQCLVGLSRDRTGHRRAEDAAQASAAEVRLIADSIPVLISYLDRQLIYRFVNRTYENWFGIPCEQIVGRHPDSIVGVDELAQRMPALLRALSGEAVTLERPWPLADGRVLQTEVRYIPKFVDGQPDGLYVFVADITERKRIAMQQAALLQLDDRLRDSGSENDIVAATTAAVAEMLQARGALLADVDGAAGETRRLRLLPDGQPLGPLRTALLDAVLNGSVLQLSDVTRDPQLDTAGAQVFARAQIVALLAVPIQRHERVVAALLVYEDSTRRWTEADVELARSVAERAWVAVERTRAERALRELNATLESRIDERTRALRDTEAALRQAQKMEAIGQLTGGIAHDLNNMLQGILGPLELLPRLIASGRSEETERYIRAATNASQRAAALTHRLLAFARRQSLDVRALDVNRLVLSMEDLLQRTLGRGMQLLMALDKEAWLALSDANQLESALLNLTLNARDAMGDNGRLSIETANRSVQPQSPEVGEGLEPGDYVCLSVRDNGSGMPADVLAKAFDPFFTTKPVGQGSGLGLSMVWGFVKQCGGHVVINSRPQVGTVVRLYLPRHVGEGSELGERLPSLEQPGRGERILIVEDDETVRVLVNTLVEELGYEAVAVGDAREALAFIDTDAPLDLLLTDISLPGMGGRELAAAARGRRPQLKVLFMTGYAPNALLRSGFVQPGMDLLTKPFTLAALTEKLDTLLSS